MPKQLLPLHGSGTLLQATVQRTSGELFEKPIVVSRQEYGPAAAAQLTQIGIDPEIILLEPAGRNTAAAIALGVLFELAAHRDSLILALPSDQVIRDEDAFVAAIRKGMAAAESGAIVTFGVPPAWAETGYGYIEVDPQDIDSASRRVVCFREKPDPATAERYVASGRHYWNSGMLLFRASAMKEQLLLHAPLVAMACQDALSGSLLDGRFLQLERQAFSSGPAISVDYAILEKSDSVRVVPAQMGWSDIGNWRALWELSDKDPNGNAVSGEVDIVDCKDCLIRNDTGSKVAVARLQGVIVVLTAAGTLVIPQEFAQETGAVAETAHTSTRSKGRIRALRAQRRADHA